MQHRFRFKITLIVCAGVCLITSPARANSESENFYEDALVRDFLLGDMTAWKFSSFCFNTTLTGLDAKAMEWQKLPGTDPRSDEERKYLRALKSVLSRMAPRPTRVVSTEGFDAGAFTVRAATTEECETSATFRLHRVITRKGKAFLSGFLNTPCASVPFGISFRKRGSKWEKQHTAYYYSAMGPPGCGYISKSIPGGPADSLLILEKKAAT